MTRDKRLRSYIRAVLVLGAFILANSMLPPRFTAGGVFFGYLAVVVLSSAIKIRLPGLTSTVSPNVIPILIGISELTLTESVLLGLAGALVQAFWHSREKATPTQLAFHGAVGMVAAASGGTLLAAIHNWRGAGGSVAFATLAVAYFVVYNLPICTANSLSGHKRLATVWRECYASSFPLFMFSAVAAGVYRSAGQPKWIFSVAIAPLLYLVYRAYWILVRQLQHDKDSAGEAADLNLRSMEALVAVIEARDGGNPIDVAMVRAYSIAAAKKLDLHEDEVKALAAAALLRDIGKMAVPDYLFSRPGKLTPAEMERVRSHVSASTAILKRVEFPFPVVPVIEAHHERWDGTGYPKGLKGEAIPIGARILGAVDALVSLSSPRPYRPAVPVEDAMAKIALEANRAFDPQVIAALEATYQKVEAPSDTEQALDDTESGEDAISYIMKARFEDEIEAPADPTLSLRESLAIFGMRLSRVVPYDSIVVYLRTGERLVPEFASGEEWKLLSTAEVEIGACVSGKVAASGKSQLNVDPTSDFLVIGQKAPRINLRSAVSVPLEGSGGVRGVLTLFRVGKNSFRVEDLRVLLAVRLKVLHYDLLELATAKMNLSAESVHEETDATRLSKALL